LRAAKIEKKKLDNKKFDKRAKTYKAYKNCKTLNKSSSRNTYKMCIAQYAIDSATFKKLFTAYRAAQATYKKDVTDFEKAGSDLKTAKKSMKIACKPCTVCTE